MSTATTETLNHELTIGEARDKFSSLIANIAAGTMPEYIVKNRKTPIAKIVPVDKPATKRIFGIAKSDPFLTDDAAFDALDAEIAAEFDV